MAEAPEEWGPLIQHDGKDCPVTGMFCEVHSWNGLSERGLITETTDTPCTLWVWDRLCIFCYHRRIVAYRIRKPRALLDLIRMAEEPYAPPPARVKELEDV